MSATTPENFLARTKLVPSGCLEWTGCLNRGGYGRVGRGQHNASRVAYRLFKGDPGDLLVCHSCDNPICVNPEHLWLGTPSDNMRDCVSKGRHFRSGQTHCKNGHEFNEKNTYQRPDGGRRCRACNSRSVKRYKLRKARSVVG